MTIVLKNEMETLIQQKLEEIIDELDCCKCAQCRMDIVSYALNRLPSKYYATEEGKVFSKLDNISPQCEADMIAALVQAVEVVKANPRHEVDANQKEA